MSSVSSTAGLVLRASFEYEVHELVRRLKVGVINSHKTKFMIINGNPCKIKINGTTLEQESLFLYIGSHITDYIQSVQARSKID